MMCIKGSFIDAQDLSAHTWNDRLILILVDDDKNEIYNKQLSEFKKESAALTERKLIVYHIKPNAFKKGLNSADWQQGNTRYAKFKKTDKPFEIILIGLDGGTKLQQNTFLSCEVLFSKIDSMPMRLNELRNN